MQLRVSRSQVVKTFRLMLYVSKCQRGRSLDLKRDPEQQPNGLQSCASKAAQLESIALPDQTRTSSIFSAPDDQLRQTMPSDFCSTMRDLGACICLDSGFNTRRHETRIWGLKLMQPGVLPSEPGKCDLMAPPH
jgi:hypothetical protein